MLLLESLIFQESPESIDHFFDVLDQEQEVVKTLKPTMPKVIIKGKAAKKLFAKLADRKFMDSLTTIHWTSGFERLIQLLKAPLNSEISCNVTRDEIPSRGRFGRYGLVVKGHITFLANDMDDVFSGTYQGYWRDDDGIPYMFRDIVTDKESEEWYKNFLKQRYRTSGINKGFEGSLRSVVLDEEDFYENPHSEALVDHWKPVAVVVQWEEEKDKAKSVTGAFVGLPDEVRKYLKSR